MIHPPTKFPRRHTQRQALSHGRAKTPPPGLPSSDYPRSDKPRAKVEQRSSTPSDGDHSEPSSDSDSDFGYNSAADRDAKAEYYRQKKVEFAAAGPTLSDPCDTTKDMMRAEEGKWELWFDSSEFKTYLLWRKDNSRIKKKSSIVTHWLVLSMVYQRTALRYMDEGIMLDIRNWIPTLGLDDSEKDKAGLFMEDLCVLQNGHWVRDREVFAHERLRVQQSALLIFAACTSTRPKALVGKRPLLYEDIEFQVFPPPVKGQPPIVILILNLKHIKRSGGKRKPKKFAFYEGENLICCPILFTVSLALADDAFENKFTSLAQIYNLIVPSNTDRIRLKWDAKWAQRPVFRDVESTADAIRISQTKALQYAKHRYHFVRLGRSCGYRKRLEFYDLRRASGKRLNEALTPEERKQIMGNRGDVYERHYMPAFIDADCQAIYLGSTRRDDLIRAVGRLERHEQAPVELTDAQKEEIWKHPDIVKLIRVRERYATKIKKRGYSTIKAAVNTSWYKRHNEAQRNLNSLKTKLRSSLLEKTIDEFHETVHITEVDQQMRGVLPAPDVLTPAAIEYELEERATVTRLLFQPLDNLDEDQVYDVRLQLVESLVQLSKRQATPHQFKLSKFKKRMQQIEKLQDLCESTTAGDIVTGTHDTIADVQLLVETTASDVIVAGVDPVSYAQNIPETTSFYCPFCMWDDRETGPRKRTHTFSRIDSLSRHVRRQHLTRRAIIGGFHCPYLGCSAFLGCDTHFLNHTERVHGLRL
ncbi:hypothetical protein D0Z07_9226 [Hyphodiscus hymeniophilus]|uniref:C2H2-type domain-containing protein n=1 Tax=Hyphodiscus hymeniophilus TaxID=353542 RepID=A0A9P6SMI3_9HELO|nr:hypothetical protein D0Z07_9226 [Hyphodiscus hymeniophilus]